MDIKRKLQIVDQAIQSISQHDDADSVVILAALEKITTMVKHQAQAVKLKQDDAAQEQLNG